MKKVLCMLLSATLMLGALAGCGGNDSNSDDAGSSTNTTTTGTPQQTAEALTPGTTDTLNLQLLFSLMNTPDSGVVELLGEGSKQAYNTDSSIRQRIYSDNTIYDSSMTFTVSYDTSGSVSSVAADFAQTISQEQLAATLTQLLGEGPSDENIWNAETTAVSLQQKEDHICMNLVSGIGNPAE